MKTLVSSQTAEHVDWYTAWVGGVMVHCFQDKVVYFFFLMSSAVEEQ